MSTHTVESRTRAPGLVINHLGLLSAIFILIAMFVSYFALDPSALADSTFTSILNSALPLMIAAAAETVVLPGGGIDLSVGAVMSLVSVIAATEMGGGEGSMLLWSVLVVVLGCAIGFLNGVLIEFAHIPAFIATLATQEVIQGVSLGVLGSPGGNIPGSYSSVMLVTSFGYIPNSGIIALILLGLYYLFRHVRSFRWLYAVGSDRQAARINGINDRRVLIGSYVVCAGIAAVAGLTFASLLSSGDPIQGLNYLLPCIAAAVIGGTSVFGGKGGIHGGIVGALILTVLASLLFAANVTPFYEAFFTGLATVLIVGIGVVIDRYASARIVA